jgi:hypothetical protein
MKKHFLGFGIALIAFFFSFIVSPIHFEGTAMGHGSNKDGGNYWIHGFRSNWFIGLSSEGERYETPARTKEVFQESLKEFESVVEEIDLKNQKNDTTEKRAIVIFYNQEKNLRGHCIIRTEEKVLYSICSTSLRHALEFEKQNFNH